MILYTVRGLKNKKKHRKKYFIVFYIPKIEINALKLKLIGRISKVNSDKSNKTV